MVVRIDLRRFPSATWVCAPQRPARLLDPKWGGRLRQRTDLLSRDNRQGKCSVNTGRMPAAGRNSPCTWNRALWGCMRQPDMLLPTTNTRAAARSAKSAATDLITPARTHRLASSLEHKDRPCHDNKITGGLVFHPIFSHEHRYSWAEQVLLVNSRRHSIRPTTRSPSNGIRC